MPAPGLTEAWVFANAALPFGWRLDGLLRGPREAEPEIHGDEWVAMARAETAPEGEPIPHEHGRGPNPESALNDLAKRLLQLRRA